MGDILSNKKIRLLAASLLAGSVFVGVVLGTALGHFALDQGTKPMVRSMGVSCQELVPVKSADFVDGEAYLVQVGFENPGSREATVHSYVLHLKNGETYQLTPAWMSDTDPMTLGPKQWSSFDIGGFLTSGAAKESPPSFLTTTWKSPDGSSETVTQTLPPLASKSCSLRL